MSEDQHWPPERMIEESYDFATFEDLEGLSNSQLAEVMTVCQVDDVDPDACVPCRAYVMLEERDAEAAREAEDMEAVLEQATEDDHPTPKLDALMTEPDVEQASQGDMPVSWRFAQAVHALDLLVKEMLEGPPIPPPNVGLDELAALVIGAERWIKIIDAQGIELSPQQEAIKHQIEEVVRRLRHGQN